MLATASAPIYRNKYTYVKSLTPFQHLHAAVDATLVPYLLSRGFEKDTRELWNEHSQQQTVERLLRWREKSLDLLEIQYDKYSRPKFAMEAGVAPPEGVDYCGYHYTQLAASVLVTHRVRLHPNRACPLWRFGIPLFKVPLLRNPSAQDVVKRTIKLFPQIETWLNDGVKGPNVKLVALPGMRNTPNVKT